MRTLRDTFRRIAVEISPAKQTLDPTAANDCSQPLVSRSVNGRGCVETYLIACFGPLFFRPWRFSIPGAPFVPNGAPISSGRGFDRGICPTISVVWPNYTLNAAIKGAIPMILRTRLKLYAKTWRLISAATFSRVRVRK